MSSTITDQTMVLDTGRSDGVYAVAFFRDGKYLLGGGANGIRWWRVGGDQEIGRQTGMDVNAISVSKDHSWIVCGTEQGATVWKADVRDKIIDVEGGKRVWEIDISPDSTKFATGTGKDDNTVNVWSITTGERLVGPLQHDRDVVGIKFSPDGERIATSYSLGSEIRIFDSHNGDQLVAIRTTATHYSISTPLAWSNDGQQLFTVSDNNTIKAFAVSSGYQVAESLRLHGGSVKSIALAANGKFIATFAGLHISLLDTSTFNWIGPVIDDSEEIYSVAISPDCRYLATGRFDGKVSLRDLGHILPDSYGPFHTSTRDEIQPDERSAASGDHDNKPVDANPIREEPGKSNQKGSEMHGENDLEVEVPSSSHPPQFDYDHPPSPVSSGHPSEDEGLSQSVTHDLPVTYPPPDECLDTLKPSQSFPKSKKWVQTKDEKSSKDATLDIPDGAPGMSPRHADHQPSSHLPAGMGDRKRGGSWMVPGQRTRKVVAKPVVKPDPKSPPKAARPVRPNKSASGSGSPVDPMEISPVRRADDPSRTSARRIYMTRESGKTVLKFSIAFPSWMCCGSSTGDETHGSK